MHNLRPQGRCQEPTEHQERPNKVSRHWFCSVAWVEGFVVASERPTSATVTDSKLLHEMAGPDRDSSSVYERCQVSSKKVEYELLSRLLRNVPFLNSLEASPII